VGEINHFKWGDYAMLLIFSMILLVFCVFMLYRNRWVYRERIKAISDYEKYCRLPSYDFMMLHFWVFDINWFLGRQK
jgi:hypothetical protein